MGLQLEGSPRGCWGPVYLWLSLDNQMPHQPWEEEGSDGLRRVVPGTFLKDAM